MLFLKKQLIIFVLDIQSFLLGIMRSYSLILCQYIRNSNANISHFLMWNNSAIIERTTRCTVHWNLYLSIRIALRKIGFSSPLNIISLSSIDREFLPNLLVLLWNVNMLIISVFSLGYVCTLCNIWFSGSKTLVWCDYCYLV